MFQIKLSKISRQQKSKYLCSLNLRGGGVGNRTEWLDQKVMLGTAAQLIVSFYQYASLDCSAVLLGSSCPCRTLQGFDCSSVLFPSARMVCYIQMYLSFEVKLANQQLFHTLAGNRTFNRCLPRYANFKFHFAAVQR